MWLRLKNFNVVSINSVIGNYDDLKHKDKNIFEVAKLDNEGNVIKVDKVKKFRKFAINLTLTPKHPQSYIVSSDDHEIGEYKNKRVDIVPFIKDEKFYYLIRDCKRIDVVLYDYLDKYYANNEGTAIIKNKIRHPYVMDDNKEVYVEPRYAWDGDPEQLETYFKTSKKFNYSKEIEWEV